MFKQSELFNNVGIGFSTENEDFLTKQLITYIGNKRALLGFIGKGIKIVGDKLSKKKLMVFDVFSGSGEKTVQKKSPR